MKMILSIQFEKYAEANNYFRDADLIGQPCIFNRLTAAKQKQHLFISNGAFRIFVRPGEFLLSQNAIASNNYMNCICLSILLLKFVVTSVTEQMGTQLPSGRAA